MSDTSDFDRFELRAREGVGNVLQLLQTIEKGLQVQSKISVHNRTLTVVAGFEADPDIIKDVIGLYASQLEDAGPFQADTENSGDWFWRIKDGLYQETSAILSPDPRHWDPAPKRKGKWTLIENDSHRVLRFTSEKKLRKYAKDEGLGIRHSPTDPFGFYTESFIYVPGKV